MNRLRLTSRISDTALAGMVGKLVTDDEYDVLLTGACRVELPNGSPLCVYLPRALTGALDAPGVYSVLHSLRGQLTDNRGAASGSPRIRFENDKRTRSMKVPSAFLGSFDGQGPKQYCRLTSWTGKNTEMFAILYPMFRQISAFFAAEVPDRYTAQMAQAEKTDPYWLIPGTPFTTVTVNNTFATGVHTDSGDLDEGFSTLACIRRGTYTGGRLVFPKWRVAVDMQHGDLLLMNAHEHHGNTTIELGRTVVDGYDMGVEPERISIVTYFRTNMVRCGTQADEFTRAKDYVEAANARVARGEGGVVR